MPHGDAVVAALEQAKLEEHHLQDLEEGAYKGRVMFLRMTDWVLSTDAASYEKIVCTY